MGAFFYIVLVLFLGLCVLLCFVILIQESKSLGLGASFGGDGGDSLFGTATATILKKFTAYLSGIFFVVCLVLSFWTSTVHRTNRGEPSVSIEEMDSSTDD